jgi:hypothetical protein
MTKKIMAERFPERCILFARKKPPELHRRLMSLPRHGGVTGIE